MTPPMTPPVHLAIPVNLALLCLALIACGQTAPPESVESGEERATEEDTARALREIANLGYVTGSEPATEEDGVVRHNPSKTWPGLNFYNSAHARAAFLIDMKGRVLHEWHGDFDQAFGRFDEPVPKDPLGHTWRRVKLIEDGAILAIQENVGLIKLDRESNVVWSRLNRAHHDLDVDPSGRIYVLCREAQYEPRFGELNPVLLDYVRVYDRDGGFLDSISIDQAYKDSVFPVTTEPGQPERDIYHTNTIRILNGVRAGEHPAFSRGNLLISFHCLDEVAILDPRQRRILWRLHGPWKEQHEPIELDNGRLLLFDNIGLAGESGPARVLEVDPLSERIVWSYTGPEHAPIQSRRSGSVQRLENGNTLVIGSVQGRVIEVTPEKEMVWEFRNPHRTGRDGERRAGIFEFTRVERSFAASWLEIPEE